MTAFKFELAPLAKFDPAKIVSEQGNDRVASFILSLALAFNDLKGLLLFREALLPAKPADQSAIAPDSGEWAGISLQVHRLLVAHLHELLLLIKEFEDEATGASIKAIMKRAARTVRDDWDELVKIAVGKGARSDTDFTRVLMLTRNNAVYHYNQPKPLVAGYRRHFFNNPPNPTNEHAYASVGQNMERTRFYFADAAVQGALENLLGAVDNEKFSNQAVRTIKAVNHALHFIVSGYIKRAKRV